RRAPRRVDIRWWRGSTTVPVTVAFGRVEEAAQLGRGPHVHLGCLRGLGRWWVGLVSRVERDATPSHGIVKCGVQDRVDVANRSRLEAGRLLPSHPSALEQLAVEPVEEAAVERLEGNLSERWHDVMTH